MDESNIRVFKNGAKAMRQPNGLYKIISGPTKHMGKTKTRKQKGGFVTDILQGVTDVVSNLVKNVGKPKTRGQMAQDLEDYRNRPDVKAEREQEQEARRRAGYQWMRLSSGRYGLFHPVTQAPVQNVEGDHIIMSNSDFQKYRQRNQLNDDLQDSSLAIGEGLRRRRR